MAAEAIGFALIIALFFGLPVLLVAYGIFVAMRRGTSPESTREMETSGIGGSEHSSSGTRTYVSPSEGITPTAPVTPFSSEETMAGDPVLTSPGMSPSTLTRNDPILGQRPTSMEPPEQSGSDESDDSSKSRSRDDRYREVA